MRSISIYYITKLPYLQNLEYVYTKTILKLHTQNCHGHKKLDGVLLAD